MKKRFLQLNLHGFASKLDQIFDANNPCNLPVIVRLFCLLAMAVPFILSPRLFSPKFHYPISAKIFLFYRCFLNCIVMFHLLFSWIKNLASETNDTSIFPVSCFSHALLTSCRPSEVEQKCCHFGDKFIQMPSKFMILMKVVSIRNGNSANHAHGS